MGLSLAGKIVDKIVENAKTVIKSENVIEKNTTDRMLFYKSLSYDTHKVEDGNLYFIFRDPERNQWRFNAEDPLPIVSKEVDDKEGGKKEIKVHELNLPSEDDMKEDVSKIVSAEVKKECAIFSEDEQNRIHYLVMKELRFFYEFSYGRDIDKTYDRIGFNKILRDFMNLIREKNSIVEYQAETQAEIDLQKTEKFKNDLKKNIKTFLTEIVTESLKAGIDIEFLQQTLNDVYIKVSQSE